MSQIINENIDFVELPVTGGYKTKVDHDIAHMLEGKKLFLQNNNKKYKYASIFKNCKKVRLHRFIMNPKNKQVVDHINGDTLDNRRSNLRCCSCSINSLNHTVPSKASSGFYGVYLINKYGLFRVRTCKDQKLFSCGYFKNKIVASIIRDIFIIENFKIRSGLNFPENIHQSDLRDFIESTNGKIFKIYFVKRSTGKMREMLCRTGVTINVNGNGHKYNPKDYRLINVYDLHKKNHRFIPIENVICLTFRKTNYLITRDRQSLAA